MYGMLVKQALLAMGLDDPKVLGMVDKMMAGGFQNPRLETLAGDTVPIPDGAQTLLVSAEKPDGKYQLIVVYEKKG